MKLTVGLMALLATCCALLYVSNEMEGAIEIIRPPSKDYSSFSRYNFVPPTAGYTGVMPPSAASMDVIKAGTFFTQTPSGAARLLDYLRGIEKKIYQEQQTRKTLIAKVRARLARNMAYAQAERRKLKKKLQAAMEKNAKRAQKALTNAMRRTQAQFAASAKLQNQRFAANQRRMKRMFSTVQKNKMEARRNLRSAVLAQQRALSSMSASMNAKIRQTNKKVSANSAQMQANDKKARAQLAKSVAIFNSKVDNVRKEAKKGRSRLAAQLAAQGRRFRQWASSKILHVVQSTASQFKSVRKKMAKNRSRIDQAVAAMTGKMTAALNAQKALQNKRFASTVKNINKFKKDTARKLRQAKKGWKSAMLKMTSTIKQQETKLSNRLSQLQGTVQKNKLAQERVNRVLNAELKRTVKLGNERQKKQLKRERSLRSIVNRNQRVVMSQLSRMSNSFQSKLSDMRKSLRRDRAKAASALKAKTAALWKTLANQAKAQRAANKRLTQQTRQMKLDAANNLRKAKASFSSSLRGMAGRIAKNEKKQASALAKLTGVVSKNEMRSRAGRERLNKQRMAMRSDMQNAINQAVSAGERRANKLRANMLSQNKQTRSSLSMRLSCAITTLKRKNQRAIDQLRLEGKRARAALKKELMAAVGQARKEAKANTNRMVGWANTKMLKAEKLRQKRATQNAAGRAKLAQAMAKSRQQAYSAMREAMADQYRSLIAYKLTAEKKIAKTNRRADAAARRIKSAITKAAASMSAVSARLTAKVNSNRVRFKRALWAQNRKNYNRSKAARQQMAKSLAKAQAANDKKFRKAYMKLTKDRSRSANLMAGATRRLNWAIAKQAALTDARFKRTVKNINSARLQAFKSVQMATKEFRAGVANVISTVKAQETRLRGELSVVSGEAVRNREMMAKVNRRVRGEMAKIINVANVRYSADVRARGKLRSILDSNKRAASRMVAALALQTKRFVQRIRGKAAQDRRSAARSLTTATRKLARAIAMQMATQQRFNGKTSQKARLRALKVAGAVRTGKRTFKTKLNVLANMIASSARRYATRYNRIFGLTKGFAKSNKRERALIFMRRKMMQQDLNKAIVRAIQLGTAKAQKYARQAFKKLKKSKKVMTISLTEKIEQYANSVFRVVQMNQQKLADNYLSVKAYCVTAKFQWKDYQQQARGSPLVSIGDFCRSIARLANVRAPRAQGVSMGLKSIPQLFSGSSIPTNKAAARINGLVAEYMRVIKYVRARWGMGIGKYLLAKLESSMQKRGVLQVSRAPGAKVNQVFMNGRGVGLSNRLADFQTLAVSMPQFEKVLAQLTALLTAKKKKVKKVFAVSPPQWQGN